MPQIVQQSTVTDAVAFNAGAGSGGYVPYTPSTFAQGLPNTFTGSSDITNQLNCINGPKRNALRAEYDAARDEWETLNQWLNYNGAIGNPPLGYSRDQVAPAIAALRDKWSKLALELDRTYAECMAIAPIVKTPEQQYLENQMAIDAGVHGIIFDPTKDYLPPGWTRDAQGRPMMPAPSISGPIPPAPATTGLSDSLTIAPPLVRSVASAPSATATAMPGGTAQSQPPVTTVNPVLNAPLLPGQPVMVPLSTAVAAERKPMMWLGVVALVVAALYFMRR